MDAHFTLLLGEELAKIDGACHQKCLLGDVFDRMGHGDRHFSAVRSILGLIDDFTLR